MATTNDAGRWAAAPYCAGVALLSETRFEPTSRAELRFRQAFDDAPTGMAVFCNDFLIVEVNAAFCELIGYRETDLLLTSFADLMHPDDLEECRKAFYALASGDLPTTSTIGRCLTAAGRAVRLEIELAGAVHAHNGRPTRYLAQFEAIAEHGAQMAAGSE